MFTKKGKVNGMSHYIGKEFSSRMDSLGLNSSSLADMTFMSKESINRIINDEIVYEDIDEFDMSLICNVLHCDPLFFVDEDVRKNDLLYSTMNRGEDTVKSRIVKAKIQDYMNDFSFLERVRLGKE